MNTSLYPCVEEWNPRSCQTYPQMIGGFYIISDHHFIYLYLNNTKQHSSRNPLVASFKSSSDAIFVVCSHTFTLFWLRKTAMSVKIFQFSFRVFACACPTVIYSIFGKSFHFPFPCFVLFIPVLSFPRGLYLNKFHPCKNTKVFLRWVLLLSFLVSFVSTRCSKNIFTNSGGRLYLQNKKK